MASALFISESYLKTFTPLSSNIDVAVLWPQVKVFQDTHIQDILGSQLYITLQDNVANNTTSTDEDNLLNLCRQALAWGSIWENLPWIATQIRNKGLMQNNSENSQSADLETLKYLRNEAKDRYEFYSQRIRNYLCYNGHLFPDYVSQTDPDILPSSKENYTCDLYFDESFDIDFYRRYLS